MRENGTLTGPVSGLGCQILGTVGFGAATASLVIEPGCLLHHQIGGLKFHPRLRQGVLYRLVLTNGATKHLTLTGVMDGPIKRRTPKPNSFSGNQDTLRIQAMQDVAKALALLPNAVFNRHPQPIDKNLVGIDALASKLVDFAHLHFTAVEIGVKKGQAMRAMGLTDIGGAGQ